MCKKDFKEVCVIVEKKSIAIWLNVMTEIAHIIGSSYFACVGLKRPPKGEWYCPICRNGN